MGSLIGHVLPGLAFFAFGLWHLFNHVKLHILHKNSYISPPWFPTSKLRYLELILIALGSSISIAFELFIGPDRHQPLDPDGTIPSNHLRNFEHSSISVSFIVYSALAILVDKFRPKLGNRSDLTLLVGAIALGQELFLFRVHSSDHHGVEGQYHVLLQVLVSISLATTLMGIGFPRCFMVSFIRSVSVLFQGLWLIVMGFMLWTPSFIPRGCFLHSDDGRQVVNCGSGEALYRAKSLVNLVFSWFVTGITCLMLCFYLAMVQFYVQKCDYSSLPKDYEETSEESNDLESPKKNKNKMMGNGETCLYMYE